MTRRSGFLNIVNTIIKEYSQFKRERLKAEREKEKLRKRNEQQQKRESVRNQALLEKQSRDNYLQNRQLEVDQKNFQLSKRLQEYENLLLSALDKDHTIDLDQIEPTAKFDLAKLPRALQIEPTPPQLDQYLQAVKKPNLLAGLVNPNLLNEYETAIKLAKLNHRQAMKIYREEVAQRNIQIRNFKKQLDEKEGNRLKKRKEMSGAYFSGDRDAISAYCLRVLGKLKAPIGFPRSWRVTYRPLPKELVVEYQLPHFEITPTVKEYKYIKLRDVIDEKLAKPGEVVEIYQDLVASITLRTLYALLNADQHNHIDIIVFNGYVEAIDPATGHKISPHLITVRTSKEEFLDLNLRLADKRTCLRQQLGAIISPQPKELLPVQPIIEFDMADSRFVEHTEIISTLDRRPNLMDLNPFEFEHLVTNLFQKMGLDAKATRSSKDGGVDAIAYDNRPILGGKIVIQAKRYKHRVEDTAIRDLFGTMQHEGAAKGILVTTSHFGKRAVDWVKNKPIELIDGENLLYLLKQIGYEARIIMPK